MRTARIISIAVAAATVLSAPPLEGRDRHPGTKGVPAPAGRADAVRVWIFFDGPAGTLRIDDRAGRAHRRVVRRGAPSAPRLTLPHPSMIERILPHVVRLRRTSAYFNAVSAEVRPEDLPTLRRIQGVSRIMPVMVFRRERIETESLPIERDPRSAAGRTPAADPYGPSYNQLAMIESVELLEAGYNGSGSAAGGEPVLIGVLDSGFLLDHAALGHVDVQAQYDFINDDTITSNEPGDHPQQDRHGTLVLGTLAGSYPGYLAGPAWGARYLLAKTEIIGEEIQIEEDNWIAGIEWCDQLGADIITSSLGYIDWYTPDSLDGNTALCTKAADIAASRGIVVCNSIGNYGYNGPTSLIAPADGDSVIAVGGVYSDGTLWTSSSRGPTADGRIKPDLVAQSVGVVSVEWPETAGFAGYSGTSFSAPLVAGLCAQLLEVHPGWTPMQLLDSLRIHASRAGDPDNDYGWGIPRGFVTAGFAPHDQTGSVRISDAYPNPFDESVRFDIRADRLTLIDARVYDARGALVRVLADRELFILDDVIEWDGRNERGSEAASGVYFIEFVSPSMRRTLTVILMR